MSGNYVEHQWQQRCFRCCFSIHFCQRQAIIFQYSDKMNWRHFHCTLFSHYPSSANYIVKYSIFFVVLVLFLFFFSHLIWVFKLKTIKIVSGKLFGFSFNLPRFYMYRKQPLHQYLSIHWHQKRNIIINTFQWIKLMNFWTKRNENWQRNWWFCNDLK